MQQPVENLMKTTMDSIKNMVDVNTVVGSPIETKDGSVVIPISKVCYAFVAGGGDLPKKAEDSGNRDALDIKPFAGGTGAGVTIMPIGFLASANGQLKMIPLAYNSTLERVIDMAPGFLDNISSMLKSKGDKQEAENE
jgi:sporulation protein YtfJ